MSKSSGADSVQTASSGTSQASAISGATCCSANAAPTRCGGAGRRAGTRSCDRTSRRPCRADGPRRRNRPAAATTSASVVGLQQRRRGDVGLGNAVAVADQRIARRATARSAGAGRRAAPAGNTRSRVAAAVARRAARSRHPWPSSRRHSRTAVRRAARADAWRAHRRRRCVALQARRDAVRAGLRACWRRSAARIRVGHGARSGGAARLAARADVLRKEPDRNTRRGEYAA